MAASHSLLCLFSLSLLLLSNTANSRHLQNNEVSVQEGVGPWGNPGYDNAIRWQFSLGDDETIIRIVVRHYDIVDAIAFTVVDANGYIITKEYGNPTSSASEIMLGDGEYITQISGSYGNYKWNDNRVTISSLKIYTNKNANGYGPYGTGADVSNVQSFLSSEGDIVGFFGTIGSKKHYLESIGISLESSLKMLMMTMPMTTMPMVKMMTKMLMAVKLIVTKGWKYDLLRIRRETFVNLDSSLWLQ